MNSSLFGARGSYDYSGNCYLSSPYPYGHQGVYATYSNAYPQYTYPQYTYPYGHAHPAYEHHSLPSYPYPLITPAQPPVQPPALVYPNTLTYGWGEPRIIIPDRGLETILIAILILVALDLLFVRPRR